MKRNKKIVLLFLFVCMFLTCIDVTYALPGDNTGSTSGGTSCSMGYCLSPKYYGVRISIVDANGKTKGGVVNVMIKLGVSANQVNKAHSRFSISNRGAVKKEYNLSYSCGHIKKTNSQAYKDCIKEKERYAPDAYNWLKSLTLYETDNSYDNIDNYINKMSVTDDQFKKIVSDTGNTMSNILSTDYLIIEPLIVAFKHNVAGYYYGTAKELVDWIDDDDSDYYGETLLDYYGSRNYILDNLGRAIRSKKYPVSGSALSVSNNNIAVVPNVNTLKPQIARGNCVSADGKTKDNCVNDYNVNIDEWQDHTYGVAIYKLGDMMSCDINKNNNSNRLSNWVEVYECDANGDGEKEICTKKIAGGCCDTAGALYTENEIYNNYPACAPCDVNNKRYTAGNELTSLDSIQCSSEEKIITNYRGTGNFVTTSTSKYCKATNALYTGQINGKYYGCEIIDSLVLPKKHIGDLKIGQYFVWPTSKTLQSFGVLYNNYPVRRTSSLNCVAYKYSAGGQLEYQTLTADELEDVRDRYKDSQKGDLTLKFEGMNNGSITIENTNISFSNNSTDSDLFTVQLESTYTLNKVEETNGIYAYYDRNKEAYTNKIVTSKLSKYVAYGYPIIPYGDYVKGEDVVRFEDSISIDYGINFDSMGFSRANAFSGSYVCTKDDVSNPMSCKCPVGTKYAGMNLEPYFTAGYTNYAVECAVAQNKYCDVTDAFKCKNGTSVIDITSCVANKTYGGSTEMEAYNLCAAQKCPNPPPPPPGDLDIIYRTIFLNNPFPSIRGSVRNPGANWGGSKSLATNKKYTGLVEEYITGTASKMYQGKPMYSITLTPKAIREIKNYNKSHGYDDFELTCGKNQYCTSDALRGNFGEYLTGGTCQLQTNAKIRGKNDCRLKALNE